MREINIKLSTGTEFTRDETGIFAISDKEEDFRMTLDEEEAVEVLVSDILKQQKIIEQLRAECEGYKAKYGRFYDRFCEANSKLYDSNTDNERLKRENEQLRQAIADARHLASYHGTTEDIYNRLIEVDPTHQTLKYLKEIEKED
ncbi:hypothetical protein P4284_16155 [Bacillus swezeyi]|uniref:hypothetical protein n=1 Tax=Bacillus swezeyi TaxID=1925020 RepID=UPI002E1EF77D|nr:hypothetical protein [Bacillus swezeyi]